MKVLHTSDWHLGHVLKGKEREEEHSLFLNWLLDALGNNNINILLISGDVFDRVNPPNYALRLYYNFLAKTIEIKSLRKIIITSGNHDLSSSLNAPKELLEALNISIITDNDVLEDEIIKIEENGELIFMVCATPFLKEKILRAYNQDISERSEIIRKGIKSHYKELLDKTKLISKDVPVIAMGHLTISGAKISNSERDIYVGSLMEIESSIFGDFDYIALGHFHKFQKIEENIYYSGSPIPLNFSEYSINENKKVIIIDFTDRIKKEFVDIPSFRKLLTIELVSDKIEELEEKFELIVDSNLKSWVEIKVKGDFKGDFVNKKVQEIALKNNVTILSIDFMKTDFLEEEVLYFEPDSLTPIDVFKRKLDEELLDEDKKEILMSMFIDILSEIKE